MNLSIKVLLFYCLPFTVFGQSYEIQYKHIISFETSTTDASYQLSGNGKKSVYFKLSDEFITHDQSDVLPINQGVVPFVIKDYTAKTVIYNQPILNQIKFIEDELPLQRWKLVEGNKMINSYNCKKATTRFRGRTYYAWYTEDLPIIGGPWKFDGLTGLILAVYSDDGVLSIEAVEIKPKEDLQFPDFKYKKKKLITWADYCAQYQKVINRIKRNMMADTDPDMEYSLDINLVEDIGLEQTKWK